MRINHRRLAVTNKMLCWWWRWLFTCKFLCKIFKKGIIQEANYHLILCSYLSIMFWRSGLLLIAAPRRYCPEIQPIWWFSLQNSTCPSFPWRNDPYSSNHHGISTRRLRIEFWNKTIDRLEGTQYPIRESNLVWKQKKVYNIVDRLLCL